MIIIATYRNNNIHNVQTDVKSFHKSNRCPCILFINQFQTLEANALKLSKPLRLIKFNIVVPCH